MSKAMTFEEFWNKEMIDRPAQPPQLSWNVIKMWCESSWELARVGMIPEDQAVMIPDVGEWPEWAKEIHVSYCEFRNCSSIHTDTPDDMIATIKRPVPVPVWVPKTNDKVFMVESGLILVGVVWEEEPIGCWITSNGVGRFYPRRDIKQFDASKIGKPWEEI